jgi:membrane protein YqaA with SNARE-associated domain
MANLWIQTTARRPGRSFTSMIAHFGALGLFGLAIVDSSPLPTFAGPDILTAILAISHRAHWYEYAVAATVGSTVGAYLTFRIARRAGTAYLEKRFKKGRVSAFLEFFKKSGTAALVASTAVPFPFPTSMCFAAAGASDYPTGRFLAMVAICRAARYTAIALIADHYGRHFVSVLRHPVDHWGWLLLFSLLVLMLTAGGLLMSRNWQAG